MINKIDLRNGWFQDPDPHSLQFISFSSVKQAVNLNGLVK